MVTINTVIVTASVVLLSSYVHAYGQIAQVVDANNFCVFLPPNDSVDRNIADTEWNAQAFCIGSAPLAKNAGKLSTGFIQSAHYLATDQYVQVTGQINPSKARLNATDDGGQMDIKAPKGSSCAGWKYYVNLIEPAGNTYCMRCCNDDRTCNRGISEKGCAHIIPGDYSGPYNDDESSAEPITSKPAVTTKTKESTKTTTKTTTKSSTNKSSTSKTTTAVTVNKVIATTTPTTTTTTTPTSNATPFTETANSPVTGDTDTIEQPYSPLPSDTSSSTNKNAEMLGQNEQVTEQSFSGAGYIQPSIMTFAIAIVVAMATMAQ